MPDAPRPGATSSWPVPDPSPPAPAVRPVVTHDPLGIDPDLLFGVARRRNPKRSALFVSRVLAKHIPVEPSRAVLAGLLLGREVAGVLGSPPLPPATRSTGAAAAMADAALAGELVGSLRSNPVDPGPVVVLGFAETATSLGHLVRDALGSQARGILTTRVHDDAHPPIAEFEEEHSHATAHRIVHDDPSVLATGEPLVLVDDELTTGRTVLNTIAALHDHAPRDRYVVAGLLDWRDAEAHAAFAEAAARLGTRIDVVSLVAGRVEGELVDDHPLPPDPPLADPGAGEAAVTSRLELHVGRAGGRNGWDPSHQAELDDRLDDLAGAVRGLGVGSRVLCLGTEELMYLPIRIAELLGPGARAQTTTRSPVVAAETPGYPIRHRRAFTHPGDASRPSFVYNVAPGSYDDVVVLLDPATAGADDRSLAAGLAGGGDRLHLVRLVEDT